MKDKVKKVLLSKDFTEIYDFLDENYENVIEELFSSIFRFIEEEKYEEVEKVIYILSQIIETEKKSYNLDFLKKIVCDANKKFNKNSYLNCSNLRNIKFQIVDLNRLILECGKKSEKTREQEIYDLVKTIIFDNRDFSTVKEYLSYYKNVLEIENKDNNILSEILECYLKIDEDNIEEITYFSSIIKLFLTPDYYSILVKDRIKYFVLLQQPEHKNKSHVKNLIVDFGEFFTTSKEKLEKKYDICFKYKKSIEEEAKLLVPNRENRINLLHQRPITIDCGLATCLDDAIFLEKNKNGTYTLYIHITDIPSLIPFRSKVDLEAFRRGETIYLYDRDVPVYPDDISSNYASLLPYQDKNVITYAVDIDTDYSVMEDTFREVRSIINIKNKMTYDEVDDRFLHPTSDDIDIMLATLATISLKLKQSNVTKDKYHKVENLLYLKMSNHSLYTDVSISNNIVQECMILLGHLKAKKMRELGLPYTYRVNMSNDREEILKIIRETPEILDNNLTLEENIILLKNSFLSARYSHISMPHTGLGLDAYSHSGSPARRYADAFGQYISVDTIHNHNMSDANIYKWEELTKETCKYLNERQIKNRRFESEYNYLASKKLIRKK